MGHGSRGHRGVACNRPSSRVKLYPGCCVGLSCPASALRPLRPPNLFFPLMFSPSPSRQVPEARGAQPGPLHQRHEAPPSHVAPCAPLRAGGQVRGGWTKEGFG